MKYFTLAWWADGTDDTGTEIQEYHRYLDSVRDSLPADLRRLSEDIGLHDARLRRLHFAHGALELSLDGFGFDEQSRAYFDRQLRLTYGGVSTLGSTADPKTGLGGPHGYGDLGYDEMEVIGAGVFEHRMLFSSGIELHVRFASFSLWYEVAAV